MWLLPRSLHSAETSQRSPKDTHPRLQVLWKRLQQIYSISTFKPRENTYSCGSIRLRNLWKEICEQWKPLVTSDHSPQGEEVQVHCVWQQLSEQRRPPETYKNSLRRKTSSLPVLRKVFHGRRVPERPSCKTHR